MGATLELTSAERERLLELARSAIHAQARGQTLPAPADDDGTLSQPIGAFVSLHRHDDGALRGCVGSFRQQAPLAQNVVRLAAAACSQDPRFPAVEPNEVDGLHIEISVLGTPVAIADPQALEIGTHGLRVTCGEHIGVLLPQVASQRAWTPHQFLTAVCRKAGLPDDAWKQDDTQLEAFRADIFGASMLEA